MNLSETFIRRPVATSLIAAAFLIFGLVAYLNLPVAALPQVDFPTLQVGANLPGASPETMASNVATPLERQFSQIPGLSQMTSSSSLGSTSVTLQFELSRNIDAAMQDVQSAINAASAQLPTNLPSAPTVRKANPADPPVMILALTSSVAPITVVSDFADNMMAQQIARLSGVGQVMIFGQQKPAVRVRVDPRKVAALGLQMDGVRAMLAANTVNLPKGFLNGPQKSFNVYANDQLLSPEGWNEVVVGYANGAAVRVKDLGGAVTGPENNQAGSSAIAGRANEDAELVSGPAAVMGVFKQPGANVIETVDRIKALLPQLRANIPPSMSIHVLSDRTQTIRASVADVQTTLAITIALVIGVIFLFLRDLRATLIPSLVIPLSLLATSAVMLALRFSIDNLSLMAMTIAVGFVVDDAIVMVEVIWRRIEHGEPPLEAALAGSREIAFTILSISISLVAVFTPLMFMGGVVGRLMREFAITLSAAVAVSVVLSLSLTPMLCAKFLRAPKPPTGPVMRGLEAGFSALEAAYARALAVVMGHMRLTLLVFLVTGAAAVVLYVTVPTGFFPQQDTGNLGGLIVAAQDVSSERMAEKVHEVVDVIAADPAVSSIAVFNWGGGPNQVNMNISLAPREKRDAGADAIIARLRPKLARVVGAQAFLQSRQDINIGGRTGQAQYQYTLSDADLGELDAWAPRLLQALRALPELKDVSSDQQSQGAAVNLTIDRSAAGRYGLAPADIDQAIYDAIGQRQVAQYFTQLNSYHVVLEAPPALQADPRLFQSLYVLSPLTKKPVPLSLFVRVDPNATSSLVISHQGQFPAATLSFNLAPGVSLGQATAAVEAERAKLGAPATLSGSFQGTAQAFQQSLSSEPVLILAALLAVYLILGVLYESYIHPLTILSTLPSAGLGALLALLAAGQDLNVIGIIAIILLIGIVKKNGIMIVDVALKLEREGGVDAREAVAEASRQRLRPILMTSACALFGGVPMALAHGVGSEFRQPLGFAIIGGLAVSQALTLFTTPVIYVYLDRLRRPARRAAAVRRPWPFGRGLRWDRPGIEPAE